MCQKPSSGVSKTFSTLFKVVFSSTLFSNENLAKEVDHFKTKYKLDFNVNADNNMVIPEFKIDDGSDPMSYLQKIKPIL